MSGTKSKNTAQKVGSKQETGYTDRPKHKLPSKTFASTLFLFRLLLSKLKIRKHKFGSTLPD